MPPSDTIMDAECRMTWLMLYIYLVSLLGLHVYWGGTQRLFLRLNQYKTIRQYYLLVACDHKTIKQCYLRRRLPPNQDVRYNNLLKFGYEIYFCVFCTLADYIVFFGCAATTHQLCALSDEAGHSRPLKRPFSKGEIKANRLSQLNHKSTAIHRKELVAQKLDFVLNMHELNNELHPAGWRSGTASKEL